MSDSENVKSLRATLYFLKVCCPDFFIQIKEINKENWNSIMPVFSQEPLLSPNSTIGLSLTNGITEE